MDIEIPDYDRLTDLRVLAEQARQRRIKSARGGSIKSFCELVMVNEATGGPIEMAPFHMDWHDLADKHDRLLIWSAVEHGKALALDTPIPGPYGWKTMGELVDGDRVFDRHGDPCTVVGKSKVFTDHEMFRVEFADGASLVADRDHRWLAMDTRKSPVPRSHMDGGPCDCGCGLLVKETKSGRKPEWEVRTTQELRDTVGDYSPFNLHRWHIPVAATCDYAHITNAVISIEPVPTVHAQCMSVDSPDNTYLAGKSYTVTHNTQQMAVARTLWELGRNPNLRTVICSGTKGQAKKIARLIKSYIESSEALHAIYPNLVPGSPWGESDFTVPRTTLARDPSVQCTGLHGNILGARIDRLVLDDILDHDNTRTAHGRKDTKDWIKSTLFGRLTKFGKVRNIGNAWHPDDLLHELAKMSSWYACAYPALLKNGTPRWPEVWSLERLAKKLEELGPVEFARQLECLARDDSTATFKREWVERCIRLGDGISLCDGLVDIPRGYSVYTGVDLAIQQHSAADLTCFFTIAIDPYGNRHVLEIDSGRWQGPDIIEKIKSVHRRFQSIVIVENNAAQEYILQFTRGASDVTVFPFTTGKNKADPAHGVQSLAVEMYNGKWVIPSDESGDKLHPEIAAWIDDMYYYDPAGHTGDRLMASWFAREGSRMVQKKITQTNIDLLRR